MIQSTALERNIADYHVDVEIDPGYAPLLEVMAQYFGLKEGLETFLKELSHPYKNWLFIVKEARGYSLDYFHLLKNHPAGPEAGALYVGVFADAIKNAPRVQVKADAVDNLLLYLQKMIREAGQEIERFLPTILNAFDLINSFQGASFFLFVKSFYQIKGLMESLIDAVDDPGLDLARAVQLLSRYYRESFAYWLNQSDPLNWFLEKVDKIDDPSLAYDIFTEISHERINEWKERLAHIESAGDAPPISRETIRELTTLPGYNQIVEIYRRTPHRLLKARGEDGEGAYWKALFLFHIMSISGLSVIHEEALRDINRTMTWIIANEHYRDIQKLIRKTFSILKVRTRKFPGASLNCVLNMGKGVYKTDDGDLINFFIDSMIDLGFQAPMIDGVGADWQIRANQAHLQNIRTWMELIEQKPSWSIRLLSSLIIHLALHGVFIRDTDLFPRDITRFLNSGVEPVYNLAKQLCRFFPVYFNAIGAEGELREVSTNVDELARRRDPLIHFLRKQSHVESSNRTLALMEATLTFWADGDKERIKPFTPPDIHGEIDADGPYVKGVHAVMTHLKKHGLAPPRDLLKIDAKKLKELTESAEGASEDDRERVRLAAKFYQLLHQKYSNDYTELDQYLNQVKSDVFPDFISLREALEEPETKKKLHILLDYLAALKEIIVSPRAYEIREDIYQKRHFAVDIPSMYGSYHEMKFDALGLTFRIESLVNVLFEELVESIDLSLITKATFYQIYARLRLFNKALKLDGVTSIEMERQLDFLRHSLDVRGFSFTQYLDIFKGFTQAVKNIINDHFHNIHEENLKRILARTRDDWILPKYLPRKGKVDGDELNHRVSEIFFRDRIAFSLGLQQLDLLLSRILNTLYQQANRLPTDQLRLLLLYDPKSAMTPIARADRRVATIINLGNKGLNLVKLKKISLPVPPGFIITTQVFRAMEILDNYPPAHENFKEKVLRHISRLQETTGKTFGDPLNPLLLSVRSGSSISQPGMMDTFLDVGINEEIAASMAENTGNPWFAWDNYRRFLQGCGMAYGLVRDDFDAIIHGHKRKRGVEFKSHFTGDQMKQVALDYKKMVMDAGIDIIETAHEQLHAVVRMVMESWESPKAKTYRRIMGISDDWGTAVTVQAMVYGNKSRRSGTGVIFTHNPRWSGESLRLWGDFTLGNQGEDVVAGLVRTLPISLMQQEIEMRNTDITLQTHFPEIYETLKAWARELIFHKGWSPQELEFTFEGPSVSDLYLLQARDMVMRERKDVLTFDLEEISGKTALGHGIGVSGGAMSGRLVFSLEEISRWRDEDPDASLILVRNDTVPDDILEIYSADGLLTARGGLTSHAAVVAHRLDKTCIVGCGSLLCDERAKICRFNKALLKSGNYISIDGREGSVYQGLINVEIEK